MLRGLAGLKQQSRIRIPGPQSVRSPPCDGIDTCITGVRSNFGAQQALVEVIGRQILTAGLGHQ